MQIAEEMMQLFRPRGSVSRLTIRCFSLSTAPPSGPLAGPSSTSIYVIYVVAEYLSLSEFVGYSWQLQHSVLVLTYSVTVDWKPQSLVALRGGFKVQLQDFASWTSREF